MNVKIVHAPALRVVAVSHKGPYPTIGAAFGRIAAWAAPRSLLGPDSRMVGVFYDDPKTTPPSELRSHAGVVVTASYTAPRGEPVEVIDLAPGDYAVGTHNGSYEGLSMAWHWLYSQWLPSSGCVPAKRPCYELYFNTHLMATPEKLITELYLPLAPG